MASLSDKDFEELTDWQDRFAKEELPERSEMVKSLREGSSHLTSPVAEIALELVDHNSNPPCVLLGREGLEIGNDDQVVKLKAACGAGAFGVVYEATQLNMESRSLAVKIMDAPDEPTAKELVANETRHLKYSSDWKLDSPFVLTSGVKKFEAGPAGSELDTWIAFVVMQLIPDAPGLRFIDRESQMMESTRLLAFVSMCNSVARFHNTGLIHRDLHPGNIVVDSDLRACVVDMGLVVASSKSQKHQGQLQSEGHIFYGAPETLSRDEGDITPRSDVFSIGVMLYEAFKEIQVHDDVDLLDPRLRPVCPEDLSISGDTAREFLAELINRCRSLKTGEIEERPENAEVLAADLRVVINNLKSNRPSIPIPPQPPAPAPAPIPIPKPKPKPDHPTLPGSEFWICSLIVVVMSGILLVASDAQALFSSILLVVVAVIVCACRYAMRMSIGGFLESAGEQGVMLGRKIDLIRFGVISWTTLVLAYVYSALHPRDIAMDVLRVDLSAPLSPYEITLLIQLGLFALASGALYPMIMWMCRSHRCSTGVYDTRNLAQIAAAASIFFYWWNTEQLDSVTRSNATYFYGIMGVLLVVPASGMVGAVMRVKPVMERIIIVYQVLAIALGLGILTLSIIDTVQWIGAETCLLLGGIVAAVWSTVSLLPSIMAWVVRYLSKLFSTESNHAKQSSSRFHILSLAQPSLLLWLLVALATVIFLDHIDGLFSILRTPETARLSAWTTRASPPGPQVVLLGLTLVFLAVWCLPHLPRSSTPCNSKELRQDSISQITIWIIVFGLLEGVANFSVFLLILMAYSKADLAPAVVMVLLCLSMPIARVVAFGQSSRSSTRLFIEGLLTFFAVVIILMSEIFPLQ